MASKTSESHRKRQSLLEILSRCGESPSPSSTSYRSSSPSTDEEERKADSDRPPSAMFEQGEREALGEQQERGDHQVTDLHKVISQIRELCGLDPSPSQAPIRWLGTLHKTLKVPTSYPLPLGRQLRSSSQASMRAKKLMKPLTPSNIWSRKYFEYESDSAP